MIVDIHDNIITHNDDGFVGLSADIGSINRIPLLVRINIYLKMLERKRYYL